MKKLVLSFVSFFFMGALLAQPFLNQILVLNEGYYDYGSGSIIEPVTVGSIDPYTGFYTELNVIEDARFASHILIDGDQYFVAADNRLLCFDLFTHNLLMESVVPGIRKMAINNDVVVVTKGEYLTTFDHYVMVLNRNDLSERFSIPAADLNYATEGVIIQDNKAYIAVNNAFDFGNEVGYIAVVNLLTEVLEETIDLGADGKNPDNLMFDGESLYTLNNKDFSGSSVSSYRLEDGALSTTNLINISSGCGTSTWFNGEIFYQELFGTVISRFNPETASIAGETSYPYSFYALTFDSLNQVMYTSVTDYFSYGKVLAFNAAGSQVMETSVGVSPGNLAMDYRNAVQVSELLVSDIFISPNPANNYILFDRPVQGLITLYNQNGAMVFQQQTNGQQVDLQQVPAGLYTLTVLEGNHFSTTVLSVVK